LLELDVLAHLGVELVVEDRDLLALRLELVLVFHDLSIPRLVHLLETFLLLLQLFYLLVLQGQLLLESLQVLLF
jgi:hypothetical protein